MPRQPSACSSKQPARVRVQWMMRLRELGLVANHLRRWLKPSVDRRDVFHHCRIYSWVCSSDSWPCACVCGRSPHDRSVWMENCVRARRDKQSVRDSARESSSSSQLQCAHPRQTEGQWQGCCVQWPEPQQHGPRCVFKVILIPRRFAAACVCGVCAGVRVPSAQGRSSSAPRGIGIQISVI